MARWTRAAMLAGALLAASTSSAAAVTMPGPNGRLVFTSGRDHLGTPLTDGRAQIWLLSGPDGQASRLTTLDTFHHRHAAWSPDRTKIAYARGPDDGTPFDGPWDIYVVDLMNPGAPPVQVTNTALNEDRPSWSPDGTRLAYAKQVAATTWDVVTKQASPGGTETLVGASASTGVGASGQFSRPQWNPAGTQIYYGRAVAVGEYDIYRSPADGSDPIGTPIVSGPAAGNDYQPALPADGSTLCFTRQGANKDVYIAPASGGSSGTSLLTLPAGADEYECTWSPDGTKIAFVRGAFGAGEILMRNSNATGAVTTVTDVSGRFDGNPDWTYNPIPTCFDTSASVEFNSFVTIPLTCLDPPDPPEVDPDPVDAELVAPPVNGALGGINDNRVIYTPNVNFSGKDLFTFNASDGTSESNTATVDITVAGPPGGGGGGGAAGPVVEAFTVSPTRWKRGNRLPRFSQVRTGTTIRVRINQPGQVTLTFNRARPGRRVRGRCVAPRRSNRSRPRCRRFVRAGTLRFAGKQGANVVRFQGRLNRRKRLPIGSYRLSARLSAGGQTSSAKTVSFRIVRG